MNSSLSPAERPRPGLSGRVVILLAATLVAFALAGVGRAVQSQPLVLLALGGVVAGFLTLVALYDQVRPVMDWAVRITIVWVPFANGLSGSLGPARELARNIDALLTLLGLGLVLLHFVQERRLVIAWTPINLPLGLLLLVDAISLWVNEVPPVIGLAGIRATLQYALLYYLIVYLAPTLAEQRRYLGWSFATCGLVAALALLEMARNRLLLHVSTPPAVSLGDRLALGLYLQVHLLLLAALMFHRVQALDGVPWLRARLPWLTNRWLLLLLAAALVGSTSRTALVGIAAGLIVLSLVTGRGRGWVLSGLAALVVLVAVVRLSGISQYYDEHYYALDQGNIVDRFFLLFTDRHLHDSLEAGRLYYTSVTWPVITDHPLLGVGPGRWGGWVATSVWPSPLYAHYHVSIFYGQFDSAFLPFWAEHGTLGLACLLWLWAGVAALALRIRRHLRDPFSGALTLATIIVIASTLVLSFISPVFESHPWSAYLWLLAGLSTAVGRQLAATKKGEVPV